MAQLVAQVEGRELLVVPPEELLEVPAEELLEVPAEELLAVPPEELLAVPPEELLEVPPEELLAVPPQEGQGQHVLQVEGQVLPAQLVEGQRQELLEQPWEGQEHPALHEDLVAHEHPVELDRRVELGLQEELVPLEGVAATRQGHARKRGVQWLGICLEEAALRVV